MQKTNINPSIYQEYLDSAANAGAKGQAQYYTPAGFAAGLAGLLLTWPAEPSSNHQSPLPSALASASHDLSV